MAAQNIRTIHALGRLAYSLVAFIVATVLGFLAGLGVGGGNLLILWLTSIVGMDYTDAKTINLLFFLPAVIITTFFRHKQGTVQIAKLLPAILGGCISAVAASFLGRMIDTTLLKKAFAILLLATGLRELFTGHEKPNNLPK